MMTAPHIDPDRLGAWLRSWDTGISSEAIFHYMTLGVRGGGTPSDPADLARCLRLLDRFPEWKPRMHEMSSVSEGWAILMPHWGDIEATFLQEAGGSLPDRGAYWSAPMTYDIMKTIFYVREGDVLFRRAS